MMKALIRKPLGLFVLSWLIAAVVTLTMVTIRWRTYEPSVGQGILNNHDGLILVFWHSRIIAMPWLCESYAWTIDEDPLSFAIA